MASETKYKVSDNWFTDWLCSAPIGHNIDASTVQFIYSGSGYRNCLNAMGSTLEAACQRECDKAHALASSAAADEVGRLRAVAQKFINDVDALRERSNREGRVLGPKRCTIVLIDDACEGIEAIRSALATDASGAMKHKESQ